MSWDLLVVAESACSLMDSISPAMKRQADKLKFMEDFLDTHNGPRNAEGWPILSQEEYDLLKKRIDEIENGDVGPIELDTEDLK